MFYKKGIDITNDKQMFNFLKNHFNYFSMHGWNRLQTIANNVKLHRLGLTGDWWKTLKLLESDDYETIDRMIQKWVNDHSNYEVYFNGRSNGYLVLKEKRHNGSILPDNINESEDYEEYKRYCQEYYGSVKANRDELVFYTKLVQDFDKLCDELRDYCDGLSTSSFEITEMEKAVELFNTRYEDDLVSLGFSDLECYDGEVNVEEISTLACLREAFYRLADRSALGYKLINTNGRTVKLCAN